jgi:hypothetical protein
VDAHADGVGDDRGKRSHIAISGDRRDALQTDCGIVAARLLLPLFAHLDFGAGAQGLGDGVRGIRKGLDGEFQAVGEVEGQVEIDAEVGE